MRWLLKEPSFGDMIRVSFGDFYHYGIYASDSEVIQFGLAPTQRALLSDSEVEVLSSDIDAFLGGGFLEVAEFDKKEKKKHRSPREAVEYARARLGMRGYNILYNNCEHFANECLTGEHYCEQTESVRAMFRSLAVADVYVAQIPDAVRVGSVIPKGRDEQIRSAGSERVRVEMYCAWRLLEYALERSFGLKMKKLDFTLTDSGKWCASGCEFSISHSGGAVAVAVSRAPIGVDIERADAKKRLVNLADGMLSEKERETYLARSEAEREEYLLCAWCMKEAEFKRSGAAVFDPAAISADSKELSSIELVLGGVDYTLGVATSSPERIRLYKDIDLGGILR